MVIETPNRLWHTDWHTSREPFFHWLPDELALEYSRFSRRGTFNQLFSNVTPESKELFYRWGRGASYHEFVLSFGIPAEKLPVINSLQEHLRRRHGTTYLGAFRKARRYERLLQRLAPGIHPGFFCPDLYLIFRKGP